MKVIKLFNRDGADLRLVQTDNNLWELSVDEKHKYVLEYMRVIGKEGIEDMSDPKNWESIDPSGGPLIGIGDIFENKYKVVGFEGFKTLIINETDNN